MRVPVTDLLSPVQSGIDTGSDSVQRDWGGVVLAHLRLTRCSPEAARDAAPTLTPEVENALLAWAVSCYEEGAFQDAEVLLEELCRRQRPSVRVLAAMAANLLAMGQYARSANYYQAACAVSESNVELLFHWAQTEMLRGEPEAARALLQRARRSLQQAPLAQTQVALWCEELMAIIEERMGPATVTQPTRN